MDGVNHNKELAQLAHLLRTCAEAAKGMAWSLPKHATALLSVATGADEMASRVERLKQEPAC